MTHGRAWMITMLAALLLASCVPQRTIRYFQDKSLSEQAAFREVKAQEYRVKPGDNLFIRIKSIDKEANTFEETQGATNYYSGGGIYFNGYSVDLEGMIRFPLIGKIEVQQLTIDEIQKKIQSSVDEYIRNTVVVVKLGSFKVSVLGEVNRPSLLEIYQDKLNVFEAISMAGDMTDFAKRSKVILIRQDKTGPTKHILDLTDQAILESDYFYLMPQDILYVEPVRAKAFAFNNFPYALVFTTITTTLLLINYFK